MNKKNWFWLILIALLTGLAFVFLPWRQYLGEPEPLLNWLRQWGKWTPLVTIGLHILQVITAPIPGTAIDAVNGLLYGPWLGTLYSMIGLMTGSWIAMLLARRFGRPLVERYVAAETIARLDDYVERYGSLFIFLVFLVPFLPDDALCFIAGLTPIPIFELMLLALLGRSPGVFFANFLGSHAVSLAAWQWGLLAGLFAVLVLAFWRARKTLPERLLEWARFVSERVLGRVGRDK